MKIVDANVLLYAVNRQSPHHDAAHGWLQKALLGRESIGLPWVSLLAFIRIATHPRIFPRALPVTEACAVVEVWTSAPGAVAVEPTPRHTSILRGLLQQAGTAGNLTTDAHLAALALEHGAEVVTFDRDFARFEVGVHRPR
jgi:toxin-antitoxin system PIN domain toxin